MVNSLAGYASILIFIIAYLMISYEEKISINKSKPALLAGILIYVVIFYLQFEVFGIHLPT